MFKLFKIGKIILIPVSILLIVSCCPPDTAAVTPDPIAAKAAIMHPDEDFSSESCSECHADVTPNIYADWKGSGHGKMDYGCYICHGDGEIEFYPMASTDGCVSCHSNNEAHLARVEYDGCFDCHDGHSLSAN